MTKHPGPPTHIEYFKSKQSKKSIRLSITTHIIKS